MRVEGMYITERNLTCLNDFNLNMDSSRQYFSDLYHYYKTRTLPNTCKMTAWPEKETKLLKITYFYSKKLNDIKQRDALVPFVVLRVGMESCKNNNFSTT